jgi:hypothetical protein
MVSMGLIAIGVKGCAAWRPAAGPMADQASRGLAVAGAAKNKGAPLGRPDGDTSIRLVQSIFQAEKITLGTAGSPAGFL